MEADRQAAGHPEAPQESDMPASAGDPGPAQESDPPIEPEIPSSEEAPDNALVVYFSATGRTKAVAETLAEAAGADPYEIKPEVPYTNADLNWSNKQSRISMEMNNPLFRPAIAGREANVAHCDIIFVGFPIWWYVAPPIINPFKFF